MKRFLSLLVCVALVLTTVGVPVIAAEKETVTVTVSKNISDRGVAECWHSTGSFSNAGYEPSKMIDGDSTTFALAKLSGASGHMALVDLGSEYDVSKISISLPTTSEVQSAIDALSASGTAFSATAGNLNMRSVIVLSNTKPTVSMFDDYTYTGEGKVVYDGGSASIKPGRTFEDSVIEDGNDYRYVAVWCPFSYGVAVSELDIWADFEEEQEVTIINQVVSDNGTAECWRGTNSFSNAGYEPSKMIDGDSSTFALAKESGGSGHLALLDLGEEYDITKIALSLPTTAEVQTAIDALSVNGTAFNATASQVNTRSIVVLSNTKITPSMFSNYTYTGTGKVVYDGGSASIKPGRTFEDSEIEDGEDYRYVGVWCPYSYGVAVSELTVWADVRMAVLDPIPMHFSKTEELTGRAVNTFGMGQLYYNGRLVNDTDTDEEYTAFITGFKDGVLEYVELEKVVAKANTYTDVSIPVIHKFRMDTVKAHLWKDNYSPVAEVSVATKKDNGYDPLFDGTILSMTPTVYDAEDVINEYNETAETPLPLTGISAFENVDSIFYDSIEYQGETKKTYAYVAIPEGASAENPVPGIVLIHGKGGTAYDRWAKAWADKGFAAISIDTDGRVNTTTNTYANSGRTKTDIGHKENVGYSDFTENESLHSDMWFYQAISDAILAANVLRSYPEVDANNIGVTGVSYGSVITMKTIGVDPRFKFAMPVYGGGFGWEAPTYWQYNMTPERKAWDPIMFLKQSGDIPVLWFVTNRDQHFGLVQISKTYTDEEVFDKANMIILDNWSHLDQIGTIIDITRDGSNGHYITEAGLNSVTSAMVGFAKQHVGQEFEGLSKVSRLNYENGKITATVTLPEGVSAEGGTAIFRYVKVADYEDLYLPVPGRETAATSWILQADGVTLGTTASSNSPWPKKTATVDGTTITVDVPADATYGFIDYTDSRGIQTSSELLDLR